MKDITDKEDLRKKDKQKQTKSLKSKRSKRTTTITTPFLLLDFFKVSVTVFLSRFAYISTLDRLTLFTPYSFFKITSRHLHSHDEGLST